MIVKKDLVRSTAAALGLTIKDVNAVVDELIVQIGNALADGEEVKIMELGKFKKTLYKGRSGVMNGKPFSYPDHYRPTFKAASAFVKRANNEAD